VKAAMPRKASSDRPLPSTVMVTHVEPAPAARPAKQVKWKGAVKALKAAILEALKDGPASTDVLRKLSTDSSTFGRAKKQRGCPVARRTL
jgi:hypothetical protein